MGTGHILLCGGARPDSAFPREKPEGLGRASTGPPPPFSTGEHRGETGPRGGDRGTPGDRPGPGEPRVGGFHDPVFFLLFEKLGGPGGAKFGRDRWGHFGRK